MASLYLKLEGFTEPEASSPSTKSSVMSSLKSKLSHGTPPAYKASGDSVYSSDKLFVILRDFLQPDSTMPLKSAVDRIADLLPDNAPLSTEVWDLGTVCFEVAEQIPYHHPSMQKLARLLEALGQSTKVNSHTSKVSEHMLVGWLYACRVYVLPLTDSFQDTEKNLFYNRYQRLGE